jgi:NADP-dependent 3-hydroxy acid dehydrogenase YdfG
MENQLKECVTLVTGASSGIGEATALELAEKGAKVALVARRRDKLEVLANKIEGAGGTALVIEADITDRKQAEAAVAKAVKELGQLDIVVNNAGVMLLGPMEGSKMEEWERMIHLNLLGLMYVTHASLPHLLKAAEGKRGCADLVNVSSVAGRIARTGSGVYNATKFGVGAFSESLRQEVTKRHLRVTLIEPGAVATELVSHVTDKRAIERAQQMYGSIKILDAEDIADAIGYATTRPSHVSVNEILIRPTEQEG